MSVNNLSSSKVVLQELDEELISSSISSTLIKEGIPALWHQQRKHLLEIPSRIDELNLHRIENFITSLNLSLSDYIIFDPADKQVIGKAIPQELELLPSQAPLPEEGRGQAIPELAIAFLERGRRLETLNSPVISEGTLVHELAHMSSEYRLNIIKKIGNSWLVHTPRIGFNIWRSSSLFSNASTRRAVLNNCSSKSTGF